jgi:hypothetical protein
MLPDFVIIGAQKSGSTFFLRCLRDHPAVFMPRGEVRFFEDPYYADGDPAQLESLFEAVHLEQALGIKRPGYLARPEVAPRIHRHLPDARLIAILRDPARRAVSAYFHLMRSGFIPVRPLEEGMNRILDGDYRRDHPKAAEILDFGFYHRHLSHYLEYFDRSRILIELFDDLRTEPLAAAQRAYRFIGVDDRYVPAPITGPRRGTKPGVYSLTRLRLLDVRNRRYYEYDADRTRRHAKPTPGLIDRVIGRAVETVDGALLGPVLGQATPDASLEVLQRLYGLYADDISRLETLLDRRLDAWKPTGSAN